MKSIFEHSSSYWVRYDRYDLREASDGKRYVTPAADAKPTVYDPLKDADALVVDALNVGMLMMKRTDDAEVQQAVMTFVTTYGLLGLMTALPTTPTVMAYEVVYLPKNNYIKEETLTTEAYLRYFFPFSRPDIKKRGTESCWNISGDRTMQALAMTFADKPTAVGCVCSESTQNDLIGCWRSSRIGLSPSVRRSSTIRTTLPLTRPRRACIIKLWPLSMALRQATILSCGRSRPLCGISTRCCWGYR